MQLTTFELELIGRAIAYVDSCLEDRNTKPRGFDDKRYEKEVLELRNKLEHIA